MTLLRGAGGVVGRAFASLGRRPGATCLAIGAIAAALALVALVHLTTRNIDAWTSTWGGGVHMVVYLEDDSDQQRADEIATALRALPAVTRIDYVDSADAYHRLRQSLGAHESLLDGVELDALPASLEVSFRPGVSDVAALHPVVDEIANAPGVDSVEFLDDWSERLGALFFALRLAALALGVVAAAASVYIIGATVRLEMRDRSDEFAVYDLVGASRMFSRGPLLVEGAVQGTVGAALAALVLWVLYAVGAEPIQRAMGTAFGQITLNFLPPLHLLALVAVGAGLGALAGWLASWRLAGGDATA